jgi:hypothetical protein
MPRMTITTPLSFQNMPARKMTDGINPKRKTAGKDPGPSDNPAMWGCPPGALFPSRVLNCRVVGNGATHGPTHCPGPCAANRTFRPSQPSSAYTVALPLSLRYRTANPGARTLAVCDTGHALSFSALRFSLFTFVPFRPAWSAVHGIRWGFDCLILSCISVCHHRRVTLVTGKNITL